MSSLLLTNGRVIDPSDRLDARADLLIQNGKVAAVGPNLSVRATVETKQIDVSGLVVCPGLIDSHVHLREPGQSAKETIATGTAAAARGGFTSLVCMPNTCPSIDNTSAVALIREKAAREGVVHVFVTGAITRGIAGEELAPIGSLKQAGVVAITDDGHCVQSNELMRRALEYVRMWDLPVLDHCPGLLARQRRCHARGLLEHDSRTPGMARRRRRGDGGPEYSAVRVDGCACALPAPQRGGKRADDSRGEAARRAHLGEGCPHHFTLTDAALAGSDEFWKTDGKDLLRPIPGPEVLPKWPPYDTNFKMNPPLRSAPDREAVVAGIVDGTLEVIGSDHAPHCDFEKDVEFDYAPFGITGLETELALSLMQLVHTGRLPLPDLIARFTTGPARLLHLDKGTLSVGVDADVTVFDPEREWVFRREETASKSRNSPFYNWALKGKAILTIVKGEIVWREQDRAFGRQS